MTEAEWLACNTPQPMLRQVWNSLNQLQRLRFAILACRRVRHVKIPLVIKRLVNIAEKIIERPRFQVGLNLQQDLEFALEAAQNELRQLFALDIPTYQHFVGVVSTFSPHSTVDDFILGLTNLGAAVAHVAEPYIVFKANDRGVPSDPAWQKVWQNELYTQSQLLRCIFGNPFQPVTLDPNWLTSDVVAMARGMYETRDFSAMPILADALQDAGCEQAGILDHCRDPHAMHVRGCWVADLLLGKR